MRNKQSFFCGMLILSFLSFFLLTSCENFPQNTPFILSTPEVSISSDTGEFVFSGVKFSLWNARQSEIKSILAVFSVFEDQDGGNPFPVDNVVAKRILCSVMPGKSGSFEVSLDPYIKSVPDKEFYVDFFYLESVEYADGQQWYDPAGFFCVRGKK